MAFFAAICLEFSPIASDKPVVPNLWLRKIFLILFNILHFYPTDQFLMNKDRRAAAFKTNSRAPGCTRG
jgi:hypothetical protein